MPKSEINGKHQLVLYLGTPATPEDEQALKVVKMLDTSVEVHRVEDDRHATPWLATPLAFFYGLDHIKGYVKERRKKRPEVAVSNGNGAHK